VTIAEACALLLTLRVFTARGTSRRDRSDLGRVLNQGHPTYFRGFVLSLVVEIDLRRVMVLAFEELVLGRYVSRLLDHAAVCVRLIYRL